MKQHFYFILLVFLLVTGAWAQISEPNFQTRELPLDSAPGSSYQFRSIGKPVTMDSLNLETGPLTFSSVNSYKYQREQPCKYYMSLIMSGPTSNIGGLSVLKASAITFNQKSAEDEHTQKVAAARIACKDFERNREQSLKVKKDSECCSGKLCNVTDFPQSCNMMEDTIQEDSENQSLYSLLSNISLKTSAAENKPIFGNPTFCDKCYKDTFKKAFSIGEDGKSTKRSRRKSASRFDELEADLTDKLSKQATNYIFRKSTLLLWKQKNLYEANKTVLEQVIARKAKGDSTQIQELTEQLTCKGQNDLSQLTTKCDRAAKNLEDYLLSVTSEGDDPKKFEIKDPYKNSAQAILDERMEFITNEFSKKWKASEEKFKNDPLLSIETKDYPKYSSERSSTLFAITSQLGGIISNKYEVIKAKCAEDGFDLDSMSAMTDILDIMVQNIDEKDFRKLQNTPKNIVTKRREALEKQILVGSLIQPELAALTTTPRYICEQANSKHRGFDAFREVDNALMKTVYLDLEAKAAAEGRALTEAEMIEIDKVKNLSEAEQDKIYEQVLNAAQNGCASEDLKIEKQNALCGIFENSDIPLKLNFSDPSLGEEEKVVLSKIQCSNRINIIDTSAEAGYNSMANPDSVIEALAGEDSMQLLYQQARAIADLDSNLRNTNSNGFQAVSEQTINFLDVNSGTSQALRELSVTDSTLSQNSKVRKDNGYVSYADVIQHSRDSEEFRRYGGSPNNDSKTGSGKAISSESSGVVRAPASEQSAQVSYSQNPAKYSSKVFNNIQSGNSAVPYQARDVEQYLGRSQSKQDNKSEILDYIDAGKNAGNAEKIAKLTDYLNNGGGQAPFKKGLSPEKRKELQAEIDALKNELNSSRDIASTNTEKRKELGQAKQRLKHLTDNINFQKNNGAGGGASGFQSASSDDIMKSFPKQSMGSSENGGVIGGAGMGGFNQAYNKALEDIAGQNNMQFNVNGDLRTLTIIASNNKSYDIELDKIIVEQGQLKQVTIDKVTYKFDDTKSLNEFKKTFGENALKDLQKFASSGQQAQVGVEARLLLEEVGKDPNATENYKDEIPQYVHLLCTMNPEDESCQVDP